MRALRSGGRGGILAAAVMFLFGLRKNRKGERKLLYSKSLPVGSSVVVRHNPGGEDPISVIDPRSLEEIDPETGERD